jgi:hypothetical protein
MGGPWIRNDDDLKQKVIDLHKQGLSASLIGARIGRTRSAVCGIIFRLREHGVAIGAPAAKTRKQRTARAAAMAKRLFNAGQLDRKPRAPKVGPIPLPREDDLARVTFADLERHHCRFICCAEAGKSVQAGEKLYCGLQIVPGTSYCEGHLARATRNVAELTPKQRAWIEARMARKVYRTSEQLEDLPA